MIVSTFELLVKPQLPKNLPGDLPDAVKKIQGRHLRPLGLQLGNKIFGAIAAPPENLVPTILDLLSQLKARH
ncbi:MAG: hypothetical protein KME57_26625 [Scytonema hyalinum WJT4-NPBG1]|jgi:hypothetical protein|nr:hypothetical protein [Scytonema hyalinum WJT4-NPBG1]